MKSSSQSLIIPNSLSAPWSNFQSSRYLQIRQKIQETHSLTVRGPLSCVKLPGSASNQMLLKSTRYLTKHLLIYFDARHSTNEILTFAITQSACAQQLVFDTIPIFGLLRSTLHPCLSFHLSFLLCFDPLLSLTLIFELLCPVSLLIPVHLLHISQVLFILNEVPNLANHVATIFPFNLRRLFIPIKELPLWALTLPPESPPGHQPCAGPEPCTPPCSLGVELPQTWTLPGATPPSPTCVLEGAAGENWTGGTPAGFGCCAVGGLRSKADESGQCCSEWESAGNQGCRNSMGAGEGGRGRVLGGGSMGFFVSINKWIDPSINKPRKGEEKEKNQESRFIITKRQNIHSLFTGCSVQRAVTRECFLLGLKKDTHQSRSFP
ncbi:hypothetical protein VP01_6053g1 [Puccinia sorghi]|uniref:Uncharacterized protein n=1 Tax=Puccinia sorghi TaxID=27349 RepID=A0A0L6UHB8_9BASI|nr:hypothetical protein VP01_6053g1 [Puccinia sorghi]